MEGKLLYLDCPDLSSVAAFEHQVQCGFRYLTTADWECGLACNRILRIDNECTIIQNPLFVLRNCGQRTRVTTVNFKSVSVDYIYPQLSENEPNRYYKENIFVLGNLFPDILDSLWHLDSLWQRLQQVALCVLKLYLKSSR